jgi:peroxiredoxin
MEHWGIGALGQKAEEGINLCLGRQNWSSSKTKIFSPTLQRSNAPTLFIPTCSPSHLPTFPLAKHILNGIL